MVTAPSQTPQLPHPALGLGRRLDIVLIAQADVVAPRDLDQVNTARRPAEAVDRVH